MIGVPMLYTLRLTYQEVRKALPLPGAAAEPWRVPAAASWLLSGRFWKGQALGLVLLVALFHAFPSYHAVRSGMVESTWESARIKFDHPLTDMNRLVPAGSHESNLTFRLTVPVIAHVLHSRKWGVLLLSAIAGIALLYFVLSAAFSACGSKKAAISVCLAVACTWPGAAGFHESRGGYYDAVALCLVAAAFATSSSWVGAFCLFVAAWTDERALIAAPFLMMHRSWGFGWLVAAYAALRVLMVAGFGFPIGVAGVGWPVLAEQVQTIPLGIWSGLGGCWLMVGSAMRKRVWFAGLVVLSMIGGLVVVDLTRGMTYCLPAVFVALSLLDRREAERLSALGALISLATPALYLEGAAGLWPLAPLPVRIMRWFH